MSPYCIAKPTDEERKAYIAGGVPTERIEELHELIRLGEINEETRRRLSSQPCISQIVRDTFYELFVK